MTKKKKLTSILWGFAYLFITICIVFSACLLFHNRYFTLVFVDGGSMEPTLNNNGVTEFGIVDSSSMAIDTIRRFDIITTYYPKKYNSSSGSESDYSYTTPSGDEVFCNFFDNYENVKVSSTASYKIKRVMALPGEYFRVQQDGVEVKTYSSDGSEIIDFYKFTFTHNPGRKTNAEFIKLDENQYWVLGDNWSNSQDSHSLNMKIYKDNIQGVLVAIEGTCKVKKENSGFTVVDKSYYPVFKYFR